MLEAAYQQSKSLLLAYDEEHNELCQRSNVVANIIEEQYSIPPPQLQELYERLQELQQQLTPESKEQRIQEANAQYQAFLEEHTSLQELFTDEEKLQINKGITPKGYLWHFDGNPPLGTMQ